MSYVERRRFLWILFLGGLALLAMTAILANATTLVHMPFEDLARQSTAVARLRCLGAEAAWTVARSGPKRALKSSSSTKVCCQAWSPFE